MCLGSSRDSDHGIVNRALDGTSFTCWIACAAAARQGFFAHVHAPIVIMRSWRASIIIIDAEHTLLKCIVGWDLVSRRCMMRRIIDARNVCISRSSHLFCTDRSSAELCVETDLLG